jgi:DNA-binding MarR family transcriptional regulator
MNNTLHGLNAILTRLLEVAIDLGRYQQNADDQTDLSRWPPAEESEAADAGLVGVARRLLKEADDRERFFSGEMFSDPVWRILLDLYVHTAERRKISVSSACVAARVPTTTALRWISDLVDRGLVERAPDPMDGRRCHLNLSPPTFENMSRYLASITGIDALVAPASALELLELRRHR